MDEKKSQLWYPITICVASRTVEVVMSKTPEPPDYLTGKQKLFYVYYLQTLNAYKSALKAGYAESTAKGKSYKWVGKSRNKCEKAYWPLFDALREAGADMIKKVGLTQERILQEIMSIAFFNHKDLLDPDTGLPLPFDEIPDEVMAGMQSVKLLKSKITDNNGVEEQTSLVEFKVHQKMKALEYLAKFLQIDPTLDYKKPSRGHGTSENKVIQRVLRNVAGKTRGLPQRTLETPE